MPRWIHLAAWLALPSMAIAQDAPAPSEDTLVIEDGGFVIEGKVQKPEVVVVINRQTLADEFDLSLDESFLPRVVAALDEDPF